MASEHRISIHVDSDIVAARQKGRELATELGFPSTDAAIVATAISELARNILTYAQHGEIALKIINHGEREGIVVVAKDDGPGIPDTERALEDGFTTSRSLGMGLPGVKRLMDEFEIFSSIGAGTTVTAKKWKWKK